MIWEVCRFGNLRIWVVVFLIFGVFDLGILNLWRFEGLWFWPIWKILEMWAVCEMFVIFVILEMLEILRFWRDFEIL